MPEAKSKKRKANDVLDAASLMKTLLRKHNDDLSGVWEQRPDLPQYGTLQVSHKLFSTDGFRKLLKQQDRSRPLQFGRDLNAARFVDGKRDTPNAEVADSKTVWDLYKQGCTLQIHQPQRWDPFLADLCAVMEQELGCLVGINAYLTPPHSQGLAPHHDDVEIFVVQTEGSKRWRLYKPHKGFPLPNQPSGDLKEEDLSDPVMDVTLRVGSILYMPRGTVHQAVAQEQASTHLTISTYQGCSYGVLAQAVLQTALEGQQEPVCMPHALRRGLPWGFLYDHGLQTDLLHQVQGAAKGGKLAADGKAGQAAPKPDVAKLLAAGLRDLADKVEQQPELVSRAADLMSIDFMDSRAPPAEASLLPLGKEPTADDAVRCRAHNAFRLVNMEPAQAPDMESGLVKVISSLSNPIEEHMMGQDDEDHHQHADGCCSHGHEHAHTESHDQHANGKEQHHSSGLGAGLAQARPDSSIDDDSDSSEDEEGGTADLVYPAAYAPALAELLSSHSSPVRVKDIRLPNIELQLDLAVSLWKEGIICVSQSSAKPVNKRRR